MPRHAERHLVCLTLLLLVLLLLPQVLRQHAAAKRENGVAPARE